MKAETRGIGTTREKAPQWPEAMWSPGAEVGHSAYMQDCQKKICVEFSDQVHTKDSHHASRNTRPCFVETDVSQIKQFDLLLHSVEYTTLITVVKAASSCTGLSTMLMRVGLSMNMLNFIFWSRIEERIGGWIAGRTVRAACATLHSLRHSFGD